MLCRPACTPLAPSSASTALAWQCVAALAATLGSLTLLLTQAPLTPLAAAGVHTGGNIGHLLAFNQGLPVGANLGPLSALLNPHADLDASVSTDGEDIAAPAADMLEFRSKDAFLAVDALWGGALAVNLGVAGVSAVLATRLAQDCL